MKTPPTTKAKQPKLPVIPPADIMQVLDKIHTKEFSTGEFIEVWEVVCKPAASMFKQKRKSWRPAVGKELSQFATRHNLIRSAGRTGKDGEIWQRS